MIHCFLLEIATQTGKNQSPVQMFLGFLVCVGEGLVFFKPSSSLRICYPPREQRISSPARSSRMEILLPVPSFARALRWWGALRLRVQWQRMGKDLRMSNPVVNRNCLNSSGACCSTKILYDFTYPLVSRVLEINVSPPNSVAFNQEENKRDDVLPSESKPQLSEGPATSANIPTTS